MAWETDDSTGLLGHFIGTVETSIWTTDSQRQDPNKPFLLWHVTVDDILQDNFEGTPPESLPVNVSIGNGWTEDEAGETVEHESGVESFKGSTSLGKIINLVSGKTSDYGSNAVPMDGDGHIVTDMKGVGKYMAAQGYDDPRNSKVWEGLQFEFRGIGFKYRNQDGDPYQNVLPVRFVGENGGSDSDGGAKTKTAAKGKVVKDTVGIWMASGASDETAVTLNDLINSATSHTQFTKQALVLDEVKSNDVLKGAVMDESVFSS